jgi:hypothetical protein
VLRWGEKLGVEEVRPSKRLEHLGANRMLITPMERPEALLELAALPMFELTRPFDWSSLAGAVERLRDISRVV